MLELIETIAAASGSIPERRRFDAGAFEKPWDPSLDRRSQLDLSAIDEQRNLPDAEHPDERFPFWQQPWIGARVDERRVVVAAVARGRYACRAEV